MKNNHIIKNLTNTKYIITFFDSKNKKIDEIEIIGNEKEAKEIAEDFLKLNGYKKFKLKKEKTIILT